MPARILSGAGQASVGPELGRKVRADVLRGVPADQSQDFGDVSFGAGANDAPVAVSVVAAPL